jgi:DNA repair protein RadC
MTVSDNGAGAPRGKPVVYEIEASRWRVQDLPARLRPREEAARVGIGNAGDDVLLALILRSGVKGANVVDLAHGLLRHYGSLTALAEASEQELARVRGVGPVKAQILKAALDLGRRLNEERAPERQLVRTPSDAMLLLQDQARTLEKEVFWVLNLDAKNRLKGRPAEVTLGLLDASLVHPREVFREAIRSATAAVVVAHNHPSGDPTPSAEDVRLTKQLVEAGRVVDIRVLDHVILGRAPATGGRAFFSMREEGTIPF